MTCPKCAGVGNINALVNRGENDWCSIEIIQCSLCKGTGMISGTAMAIAEGRRLRAERIARDESIGEMAKRLGVSPAEISRQERGVPA